MCMVDMLSHRALDSHLEGQVRQTLLSVFSCIILFCFSLLSLLPEAKIFMFSPLKDTNIDRYFRRINVMVVNTNFY